MIRGDVWQSRYSGVWLADVIDEDGRWLASATFTAWDYAMRWTNAEVVKQRRRAHSRRVNKRRKQFAYRLNINIHWPEG